MANTQPIQQQWFCIKKDNLAQSKSESCVVTIPKKQRTLETPVSCQAMLDCHIYGKKPSVMQYLNPIKQDWHHTNTSLDEDANKRDLAWVLTRLLPTNLWDWTLNLWLLTSWSAFNTMVSWGAPSTNEVGYCPMINVTSTDYNTVFTVMKYNKLCQVLVRSTVL